MPRRTRGSGGVRMSVKRINAAKRLFFCYFSLWLGQRKVSLNIKKINKKNLNFQQHLEPRKKGL
jgi:hypothetical protein